jgi:hypothetical protein
LVLNEKDVIDECNAMQSNAMQCKKHAKCRIMIETVMKTEISTISATRTTLIVIFSEICEFEGEQ